MKTFNVVLVSTTGIPDAARLYSSIGLLESDLRKHGKICFVHNPCKQIAPTHVDLFVVVLDHCDSDPSRSLRLAISRLLEAGSHKNGAIVWSFLYSDHAFNDEVYNANKVARRLGRTSLSVYRYKSEIEIFSLIQKWAEESEAKEATLNAATAMVSA